MSPARWPARERTVSSRRSLAGRPAFRPASAGPPASCPLSAPLGPEESYRAMKRVRQGTSLGPACRLHPAGVSWAVQCSRQCRLPTAFGCASGECAPLACRRSVPAEGLALSSGRLRREPMRRVSRVASVVSILHVFSSPLAGPGCSFSVTCVPAADPAADVEVEEANLSHLNITAVTRNGSTTAVTRNGPGPPAGSGSLAWRMSSSVLLSESLARG